jgi:hypothetical protein
MTKEPFQTLRTFITDKMRMSHIYQPVMLKVLLENGGRASRNAIARAFLNEDRVNGGVKLDRLGGAKPDHLM